MYLLSTRTDLLPPLVSSAFNAPEVVCGLIPSTNLHTHQCSLSSGRWVRSSFWSPHGRPIFVMPNGFPVTIFTVLQSQLFVDPATASGIGCEQPNASFNFCLSISCFSRCSISFAARPCFTLLIASAAAFS